VDPDSGFIRRKEYSWSKYKSIQLPGLWNGAMANWLTVFVEVPLITIRSNDLLNSPHQPQ
jgi:hypothetical protein